MGNIVAAAAAVVKPYNATAAGTAHTLFEDIQAIITGALLASLGVAMLAGAGLITGGVVGVAFLLHYASGVSFGTLLIAVNLPFYLLALHKKGWKFALKTFSAVLLVSLFAELLPLVFRFSHINALYAAAMGGLLAGVGMLVLFRHNASLGGFNILALYLQDRFGWHVGLTQLAIDSAILLTSFAAIPPALAAISLAGAAVLNLLLAINHRLDRYQAI